MKSISQWLDDTKSWWALAAIGTGLFALAQAMVLNRWTVLGWPRPTVLGAIVGILFGIAVVYQKPWARWLGVVWIPLLATVPLVNGILGGWSLSLIICFPVLALMAVAYYFAFYRETAPDDSSESERPFLSLVLLLREPRYLDSIVLASLASKAWDIDVDGTPPSEGNDEDSTGGSDHDAFVVGQPPLFMAKHPSAMCVIHDFDRPYFSDPDSAAEDLNEVRVRNAILQHQAWIAVDVLHWFGEGDAMEGAYRLIARLLAELADDNVLAVIDPDASRIYAYDPETERKLRSDNPLEQLRTPYYVPVIPIPPDDPEMKSAVAEARHRWPEFVTAFERRDTRGDDHYSVKAPFGEGDNVEFMWIEVTGIENDIVYGILGNEPAGIPVLHEGDRVKTKVADINDWIFVVGGEPLGGFTVKVVMERANQSRTVEDQAEQDD